MKRSIAPIVAPEYRDRTPDAASDTKAGMERLLRLARERDWFLVESTRLAAIKLGVDITGVKFRGVDHG
jgi:hypothetical protein